MRRVENFMKDCDQPIDSEFNSELFNFRMKLIAEEFMELAQAGESLTLSTIDSKEELLIRQEDFLKEMSDCIYVIYGMAVTFGWDLEEAFNRVHQSNMTKLPYTKLDDGKVQKGPNYEPPTLEGLIN
jgi:predicted HAD superfamily Cof-like phosphohydrolase|tara:strand:- start:60 stop:440 length:381 start_codon:yes stop_codon:yes gene_type:complete